MEKELTIDILSSVQKPARYTGGEFNSIVKSPEETEVSIALAFPDIYEVGMSYLGFKILYHILNLENGVAAERVYAPWVDLEAKCEQMLFRCELWKRKRYCRILILSALLCSMSFLIQIFLICLIWAVYL